MTKGTGFESCACGVGFWIWIVSVAADCTSTGLSVVEQVFTLGHVVARALPLIRIVDAALPEPATKFKPCTEKGKLSTAPAITLDGRITSIAGPLVMVMAAVADFVVSAIVVAMTEVPLGGGATVGGEEGRVASAERQAAPAEPWPVTALWTVQVTLVF